MGRFGLQAAAGMVAGRSPQDRDHEKKLPRMSIAAAALLVAGAVGRERAALAQSPTAPVWGLYASYVGGPPLFEDPCNITYTVAWIKNATIAANVAAGTMVAITEGVTWSVAQSQLRKHSQYFDDKPDDIVKIGPCNSNLEKILKDIDLGDFTLGRDHGRFMQKASPPEHLQRNCERNPRTGQTVCDPVR
jgi:hypothetical protein